MKHIVRVIATLLLTLGIALPAEGAVTITFWSHELGNSFPHAFFTLRGIPDAGGSPVDSNYGFTAKSISPAILFGPVAGRLDSAKPGYIAGSDAQFSIVVSDKQYASILLLVSEWSGQNGGSEYRLNDRNCVTFVQEAARRIGLTGLEQPKLMKKPRSFLKAVATANGDRVTVIDQHGKKFLASLPSLTPAKAANGTVTVATGP